MASEPSKQPRRNDSAPATPPAMPGSAEATKAEPAKPQALFRGIDWLAFALTTFFVFCGYFYTIAPDMTLQDSGELAVASHYAGVPHPPGYPVWTIYTWLFTKIIPFGNIAWRVGISSAVAGALTCGLIALMVSRGGSMLMESIVEFRTIARRIENSICLVTGFVSGMLIGFNGFMWSQSIIVEVYALTMLTLVLGLVFLLRWTHAPNQHRYLFLAWFLCGITFNNHQSLLVITLAMVVLAIMVQAKVGREFLFWCVLVYLAGAALQLSGGFSMLQGSGMLQFIYHGIGLALFVAWIILAIKTKIQFMEFLRNWVVVIIIVDILGVLAWLNGRIGAVAGVFVLLKLIAAIAAYVVIRRRTLPLGRQWKAALGSGVAFIAGVAFYLYMPLASMTNPPLNWGYPRTVAGFIHAFTRGQYEKIRPTTGEGNNIISQSANFVSRYTQQVWYILIEGPIEEFNFVYVLTGFIPLFFLRRVQTRERAWLIGLIAFYFVLGPFLLELFNPAPDRQSLSLNKPFFIASHVIISMFVGYGLVLLLASVAARDRRIVMPILFILGGLLLLAFSNSLVSLIIALRDWFVRHSTAGFGNFAMSLVPLVPIAIGSVIAWISFKAGGAEVEPHRRVRGALLALLLVFTFFAGYHVVQVFDDTPYVMLRITALSGLLLAVLALGVTALSFNRSPVAGLLAVVFLMPIYPMLGHWSENEQRNHFFGYWFGHDMFTPPFKDKQGKLSYNKKEREELLKTPEGQKRIYPEMTRDAVLFGGTDPGRFCPTYMIFSESFTAAKDKPRDPAFDRRDVYIITQNALADGTYLQYIRAHFYRGDEYQYDTPFFQELLRPEKERANNFKTNLLARMVAVPLDNLFGEKIGNNIEKARRAGSSFFQPEHFVDLAGFARKLDQGGAPAELSKYLRDHLSEGTRKMLGTPNAVLAESLSEDLNKLLDEELEGAQRLPTLKSQLATASGKEAEEIRNSIARFEKIVPFYTPERFKGIQFDWYMQEFIKQDPRYSSRIRLNRRLVEHAYPEIAKSLGGVYPDKEIYTPTPEDSSRCFQEYMADAQQRMAKGQLKPGEDVRVQDGKVQVSGQVAVMAINGLLTKVIFEHNPNHEFFVEESFPLEWMYDYLTPFGVIMKINREKVKELTPDIVFRDHEFWSDYSTRLIGNWITYDTPVSNIVAFAEHVYLRKDFRNFTGDPRFVRDDDGQKAFSKLRSSIAGVYAWRLGQSKSQQESERMFREAEFSFKQAYAFCPYSPEALYRYVNLLAGVRRFDDALLLAKTSYKLDPGNTQLERLVEELQRLRDTAGGTTPMPTSPALQKAENDYKANKGNFSLAVAYAQEAAKAGDAARVINVADDIVANSNSDATAIQFAMQIYSQPQIQNYPKLESALKRWVKLNPAPESWLDLAGAQSVQNKTADAIGSLRQALALDATRRKANPNASNILGAIEHDPRLGGLRATPEFKALMATNK